jgi:hypothetical protein
MTDREKIFFSVERNSVRKYKRKIKKKVGDQKNMNNPTKRFKITSNDIYDRYYLFQDFKAYFKKQYSAGRNL